MGSVDQSTAEDHRYGISGTLTEDRCLRNLFRAHTSSCVTAHSRSTGRQEFPAFPYEPYDIQRRFMESMYATLEAGGVGLFESPTGAVGRMCSKLYP